MQYGGVAPTIQMATEFTGGETTTFWYLPNRSVKPLFFLARTNRVVKHSVTMQEKTPLPANKARNQIEQIKLEIRNTT